MPWKTNKSEIQLRKEFIDRMMGSGIPVARLCREFGVSRKTAYKWKRRYLQGGSLENASRRPRHSRGTSAEVVVEILKERARHRYLGGRKIGIVLKRRGIEGVPSGTTITSILRAHDLLDKKASQDARRFVRFQMDRPNRLWQADFKGHFALGDGGRCHTLNVIDDCSRFCLCCEPLPDERFASVRPAFEGVFRAYGLPDALLCDNGMPWGHGVGSPFGHPARKMRGLTAFEVWLMELGVLTVHGRPLHPQTQGKDERFNRTFAAGALRGESFGSLAEAKPRFEAFRSFYNEERPHSGIGERCPAELYRPSPNAFPEKIAGWDYPSGSQVRKVTHGGMMTFHATKMRISVSMTGRHVAVMPSSSEGVYNIVFRKFLLAKFDQRTKTCTSFPPYLLNGDPRPTFPGL